MRKITTCEISIIKEMKHNENMRSLEAMNLSSLKTNNNHWNCFLYCARCRLRLLKSCIRVRGYFAHYHVHDVRYLVVTIRDMIHVCVEGVNAALLLPHMGSKQNHYHNGSKVCFFQCKPFFSDKLWLY